MRKQLLKRIVLLLCMFGLLAGNEKSVAYAKTEQHVTSFSGDVAMLKQESNGYVMQVTVGNSGEDFTGTVQMIFASRDSINCAYNTEMTLPAQGKKQFTVNVTNTAVDTVRGICVLNFLDEKGNVLQSIQLKDVFGNAIAEIQVGVLSDHYAELAFMEAKGETFNIHSGNYPLELIQLNNDNLKEYLNGLYFLIIDQFDVSSLSEENIESIQNWVRDGGLLIIGTGKYAEQTLSGFNKDFIGVSALSVSEPGEENIVSANIDPGNYDYYMYTDDGIDFTNMAIADLYQNSTNGDFYMSTQNPAICGSVDEGAILIFYFALGDAELQKLSRYTISNIYDELMTNSAGYQSDEYSEGGYIRQRVLSFIDSVKTNVDFTGLKIMILLYVVLIGPVLYLILRRCKKCEWYWLCVPVLGAAFIVGVYFIGSGIRVNEARVYSVTAQKADSNYKATYFLAYHSGTEPWTVPLNTDYEMAGPGESWSYYYGGYGQNADDYYYIVDNNVDGLSVGMKPEENFEGGFFYAEGRTESKGTILCEELTYSNRGKVSGIITNGTYCDMSYMAVWFQDNIFVFSDVKAQEMIDLEQAMRDGRCVYENTSASYYSYSPYEELLYDMVSIYDRRSDMGYEQDDIAALLIGLGIADRAKPAGTEQAVVIGVVKDYEKIAAGKCSENSYGCLYSYARMEGGQNASN